MSQRGRIGWDGVAFLGRDAVQGEAVMRVNRNRPRQFIGDIYAVEKDGVRGGESGMGDDRGLYR